MQPHTEVTQSSTLNSMYLQTVHQTKPLLVWNSITVVTLLMVTQAMSL